MAVLLVCIAGTWALLRQRTRNVLAEEAAIGGAVAEVTAGGEPVQYDTFARAWAAATSAPSACVKLLDDVVTASSLKITSGDNVTLDLNGYALKREGSGSVIQIAVGALTVKDSDPKSRTHRIDDVTAEESGLTAEIAGGLITGGNSTQNGGGIYVLSGSLTLLGGTVAGNSAEKGGGIFVNSSAAFTMTGGSIVYNAAGSQGGGIMANSNKASTVSGGTIAHNTAIFGGGLYVGKNTVQLENTVIMGNIASENGGGIYVYNSGSIAMSGGEIAGNSAGYEGGGAYVGGGSFTVSDGEICGNTASHGGGGILLCEGTLEVSDGVSICRNTTRFSGGGLCILAEYETEVTLSGGEISGNSAEVGGGVYLFGGDFRVGGGLRICGNAAGDLYLGKGKIAVGGKLTEGAEIGVKNANGTVTVGYTEAGNAAADWNKYFFDNDGHPCQGISEEEVYFADSHIPFAGFFADEVCHWKQCGVCCDRLESAAHTFEPSFGGRAGDRLLFLECTETDCPKHTDAVVEPMTLDSIEAEGTLTATAYDREFYGEFLVKAAFGDPSGEYFFYDTVEGATVETPWVTVPRTEEYYLVSDSYVTLSYAENGVERTSRIPITVGALQVAVPRADGTEFLYNGTEQTYRLAGVTQGKVNVSGNVQKNAGVYPVMAALSDKQNCVWAGTEKDTADITFSFKISKAPLTIKAKDSEIVYGEEPVGRGVVFGAFAEGENESVLGGAVEYRFGYETFGDVGEYTVQPYGYTAENYEIVYLSGVLTVKARELRLQLTAEDCVYTGEEKRARYTLKNCVNGDEKTLRVSLFYNGLPFAPVKAGRYRVTAAVSGGKIGNYFYDETVQAVFEIAKAKLNYGGGSLEYGYVFLPDQPTHPLKLDEGDYPTAVDGSTVALSYAFATYDGTDNGLIEKQRELFGRVQKGDLGGLKTEEWKQYRTDDPDLNISLPKGYCVFFKAEAENHETLYGCFSVRVDPALITLRLKSGAADGEYAAREYGDAAHTQQELWSRVCENIASATVTAADGKENEQPLGSGFKKEYFRFVLIGADGEKIVLGERDSGDRLPVGRYEIAAEYLCEPQHEGGERAYISFRWSCGENPGFCILPRQITVTPHCTGHVYGATPQTQWVTLSAVRANGALGTWMGKEGETLDDLEIIYCFESYLGAAAPDSKMTVGNYPLTCRCLNPNYSAEFLPADYAVAVRPLTATLEVPERLVYGAEGRASVGELSGVVAGDDVRAELVYAGAANDGTVFNGTEAPTLAGSYRVSVRLAGSAAENYSFTSQECAYVIEKAALTVAAEDKTTVYGEGLPLLTVAISGLLPSDRALEEKFSARCAYSVGDGVGGEYPIEAVGPSELANYSVVFVGARLEVTLRPLRATVAAEGTVYGLQPSVSAAFEGLLPADEGMVLPAFTFYGRSKDGRFDCGEENAVKELPLLAGIYTVAMRTVFGERANNYEYIFSESGGRAEFEILPKSVALEIIPPEELTYLHVGEFLIEVGGIVGQDVLEQSLTYFGRAYNGTVYGEDNTKAPEHAGNYTVRAELKGECAANYLCLQKELDYEIKRAVYDMSGITFSDGLAKEDGSAHMLGISGELPEGVTVTYAGNGRKEPGVYEITATFDGDFADFEPIAQMRATLTVLRVNAEFGGHGAAGEEDYLPPEVTVESSEGMDPEWELSVEKAETDAEVLFGGRASRMKICVAYSVKLLDGGGTAPVNGNLTVRIRIPAELKGKLFDVFGVYSDGESAELKFLADGDYAVMETDVLCTFVFAYENSSPVLPICLSAALAVSCAAAVCIFCLRKKRR